MVEVRRTSEVTTEPLGSEEDGGGVDEDIEDDDVERGVTDVVEVDEVVVVALLVVLELVDVVVAMHDVENRVLVAPEDVRVTGTVTATGLDIDTVEPGSQSLIGRQVTERFCKSTYQD